MNYGVDLNRNYGYKFNSTSDRGSSSDPCQETYRGTNAFSELETQAIKNLVESSPDIKIAYNYHSFGNVFLIPYSYYNDPEDNILKANSNFYYTLYKNFEDEKVFPEFSRFGNVLKLLSYSSDGEASDWMLGERGILTFSPELGTGDYRSEKFYPEISVSLETIKDNFPSALFGIQKSSYSFKFNGRRSFNDKNNFYDKISPIAYLNYNNNNYFFWAYCRDIEKNSNLTLVNENEFNLLYFDNYINNACDESYKRFYSISATIFNEGLGDFNYKGLIKMSLKAKGIRRVVGNFIKFFYLNSTVIHLDDILDSEESKDVSFKKINYFQLHDLTVFEYNYDLNYLDANTTFIFDLKLFSESQDEKELNNLSFSLDIDFEYAFENKINRKFKIYQLNATDFKYFDFNYNLFANKVFDINSLENYMVHFNQDYTSFNSLSNKHSLIYKIAPPIIVLLIVFSILFIIYRRKLLKGKNITKEQMKITLQENNKIDFEEIKKSYQNNCDVIVINEDKSKLNNNKVEKTDRSKSSYLHLFNNKGGDQIDLSDRINVVTIHENNIFEESKIKI